MTDEQATEHLTLGTHLGYEAHVGIARDTNGYAVTLYVRTKTGEREPIATVMASQNKCQIDRLYLPTDHSQRKGDKGLCALMWEGALQYITENGRWKEWLERYESNHGLP